MTTPVYSDPLVRAGASAQRSDDFIRGERLALRSTRPRRNRWKALAEIDAELVELQQREAETAARVRDLDSRTVDAVNADQAALAEWLAAGRLPTSRPRATADDIRAERDRLAAEVDAYRVATETLLEKRVQHVERHRGRMVKEAAAATAEAQERYKHALARAHQARRELVESRSVEVWAACFPDPAATETHGAVDAVCAGLLGPVKQTIGFESRLEAAAVFALLAEDGQVLAGLASPAQRKQMHVEEARTPEREALWDDDPEMVKWKQRKRREFQEAGRYATPDAFAEMVNEVRG